MPKVLISLVALKKWDAVEVCEAKQLHSDTKAGQTRRIFRWKGRPLQFSTRGREGALQFSRAKCSSRQRRKWVPLTRSPTHYFRLLYTNQTPFLDKRVSTRIIRSGIWNRNIKFHLILVHNSHQKWLQLCVENEIASDGPIHWFHISPASNSYSRKIAQLFT